MINRYLDEFIKNKIPVFLLPPHRKDPIPGSRGFKDWTKDEKIIRSWKTENMGIPTGDISGIFVYDCDIKTGENGNIGINGLYGFLKILKLKTLDEYIQKYPDAFIVQTGSGYQFYFKIPVGLDHNLRNTTNINGIKGLDVRGNGGYVVAPGSIHPNGNEYKIIHGSLDKIPLMPEKLYNLWYEHDHPDLLSDDFNEPRMPLNLNDENLNLDIKTTAMIFKKTPASEGNNLLMAHAGLHALRDVSIENEKLILKEAAALNHWNGKINFATVDDSYRRVELQKKGNIPADEKSKTFVKGYTTLKRIIMENRENYSENYDEIIKNLEYLFESHESPFYDVDGHNVKHFNKGKSIKYVMSKYPFLYTDDFDNLYYFSVQDGWHNDIENSLKNFIQTTDDSLSEHNINEIISGIKHITYNKEFKNNPLPNNLIPLPSGLYNVENHALEKHNNNYFYSNINRNFIPGVKEESLALSRFLDKVLTNPEKDKLTVYESIAWSLLNDNNIQGMIIFYGEGGNGKGIIQNSVIANLLGHENAAMPDLSRIANYPFELQSLINKKALLFSESIKGVTYNWEILKRITGHDYENIPIKNKPAIQYQYKSAVFLSTNNLIPPKDELSIWRRIINIVEFSNYLNSLSSDEISKIVSELQDPNELDKLFSFIVDNIYPEFIKHGFKHRYNINTAKEKYLMKSNPAITYLKLKESRDEILTDPNDVLEYCKAHNYNQNNCYFIDKNGNETIFQIKELLIKQVNQFCSVNHLPKYDVHDRNSQTKIGQAIHYMGLDVSEYRKRMSGKLIHAWSGIFVTPDDDDLKIPEEKNPDEPKGNNQEENKTGNTGIDNDIESLPDGPVKQSLIEEQELKELEKNKNIELTEELQARATQKIFELLDSKYQPVHELDNIRRNLDYLSDDQFNFLIDTMIKSSIVKIDGRRLEKIKSDPEKNSKELIYRKSREPAADLPIEDSYTRSEWHYYAFDKSKININSKAWIQFSMKSEEVSEKEFSIMRGDLS